MYEHVLIPTDGSDRSHDAAAHGVELARRLGARVTGITVSEPFQVITFEPMVMTDIPEDYEAKAKVAGHTRLAPIEDAAKAAGVPCEVVHVFHEHPWEAIIEEATKRGCDLIVMASHGRRGMAAVVLGSETNKVLTHCTIPTLVYR
ncbi:MAG: universal stress protein [Actinomycetota bacterium]|jgi:nucleotide-binding universal stress UspA family protein